MVGARRDVWPKYGRDSSRDDFDGWVVLLPPSSDCVCLELALDSEYRNIIVNNYVGTCTHIVVNL